MGPGMQVDRIKLGKEGKREERERVRMSAHVQDMEDGM